MCFTSRYSSYPISPCSRPIPDCLYPPNGYLGLIMCQSLIQTVPVRRPSATFTARPLSADHTPPANPYVESLAMATASFSSSKAITARTGPKISSRAIRMSLRTPVKIVGRK